MIAKPLTDLTKHGKIFEMGDEQISAVDTLKKMLSKKPVLGIFNQQYETEVHTDASIDGYGAVLFQKFPDDNKLHPIYYMSKKTSDAERKYSSYELEILAVIAALEKFRVYLLGLHFKLVTDCNAFTKTLEKKELSTRVARWVLRLQEYDYQVEHRSGLRMKHVDAFSRYPVMVVTNVDILTSIRRAQQQDEDLRAISEIIKEKQAYNDYFEKSGILHKLVDDNELVVVPKSMQREVIRRAHGKGHFAMKKTKELICREFFIPKLEEKIRAHINNCVSCIVANRKTGKQEGKLHPLHKEATPLYTYHIDFLGPLESTNKSYKHIFAVVDSFTKFAWLYPTKSTSAQETISRLKLQSATFGSPVHIISDRGSAFTSDDFRRYCNEENIQHSIITTGLPRANGQVERLMSIVTNVLTKLSKDDPTKWYKFVDRVQQVINSTFNRSINMTPFELLIGVKMRTADDFNIKNLIEDEIRQLHQEQRNDLRQQAKNQILKIQDENRKTYNLRRKEANQYALDEFVAVKRTQFGGGLKLKPKYLGPYRIVKIKPNNSYDVVKAAECEGPNRTSTCAEYMKPWVNYSEDDIDPFEGECEAGWPIVGLGKPAV
ncbi:unnamed protein product [Ceratitis capitata]|uniref:RNA-directed DNA polymerase n=1 Tax=Ceratitis capitata TaxID=7213 RepID=A0A811VE99_CERCA|nr:unnamed protein product [Ceratitis capitata]